MMFMHKDKFPQWIIRLSYNVFMETADDLVTQVVRISTATALTYFSLSASILAPKGLDLYNSLSFD